MKAGPWRTKGDEMHRRRVEWRVNRVPRSLEQHGLVVVGVQPVHGLVPGAEDLEVFHVAAQGLKAARKIEGGVGGGDHRAARVGCEDLTLEALGEGLERVLVQVGAGETSEVNKVGEVRVEARVALQQVAVRKHVLQGYASQGRAVHQPSGGVDRVSYGHLPMSLIL